MAKDGFRIKKSLNVEPISSPTLDQDGDIAVDSATNKLKVRLNSTTDSAVLEAATQTLTNKTIDAASNTVTNVSLSTGVTGTLPIGNGGTGQTAKAAAFDALSPMTTSGDVIYGGASGTGTRLAKGTDGQVLALASGLPAWTSLSTPPTYNVQVSDSSGSATSRNLSTIGSANYGAMSVNTISITAGKWELTAYFQVQAGTGTGVVLYSNTGIYAANGADSSSVPAALSTVGTVSGPATFQQLGGSVITSPASSGGSIVTITTYISVASTQSVYAVPRVDYSSAGTANVSAYIMGRKLYD